MPGSRVVFLRPASIAEQERVEREAILARTSTWPGSNWTSMPEPGRTGDPVRHAKLLACLALVFGLPVYGQSPGFGFTNFMTPVYVTGKSHVLAGLGYLAWAHHHPGLQTGTR